MGEYGKFELEGTLLQLLKWANDITCLELNDCLNLMEVKLTKQLHDVFTSSSRKHSLPNLSRDQKPAVLMLKDAVYRGRFIVSCTKYSVPKAPCSTQRIQSTFILYITPVKNDG